MLNQVIPKSLVLEVKFNISDEVLSKNTFISLDVEKLKLEEINKKREKNSMKIIEYGDIEKYLNKVSVKYDSLEIILNEDDKESKNSINLNDDMLEDIKSLFIVNKKCIDKESLIRTIHLNYDEDYKNQLLEDNDKLFGESYKKIYQNNLIKVIGLDNFNDLNEKKSKFSPLYLTLMNNNLNLLKNSYNDLKDTESYKFSCNNDLLIYLPDVNLIDIPSNIYGEMMDIESMDFTLRYPMDCENSNLNGQIIHKYSVNSTDSWSNDIVHHNVSKVDTSLYPQIILDNDKNLTTTKPVEKKEYYLRLFYGINKKIFETSYLQETAVAN
jgi:hypothetical protein